MRRICHCSFACIVLMFKFSNPAPIWFLLWWFDNVGIPEDYINNRTLQLKAFLPRCSNSKVGGQNLTTTSTVGELI